MTNIAFGPRRSTLGNLPESPTKFPMATFVKRKLETGVKPVFLDSVAMRRASPPEYGINGFADDGSNLPWVIKRLRDQHPTDFKEWHGHVRTVLSDLRDIRVVDRPEDRHAYLLLRYDTGVDVPSWMASDGTMRLLALTLLAYLPENREIYLLEEPENGVHPLAVEGICDSLSSAYDAQVLVTTHSPALLALVDPREVLCFDKNLDGATDIVRGDPPVGHQGQLGLRTHLEPERRDLAVEVLREFNLLAKTGPKRLLAVQKQGKPDAQSAEVLGQLRRHGGRRARPPPSVPMVSCR